jgi:hypothetical protein
VPAARVVASVVGLAMKVSDRGRIPAEVLDAYHQQG